MMFREKQALRILHEDRYFTQNKEITNHFNLTCEILWVNSMCCMYVCMGITVLYTPTTPFETLTGVLGLVNSQLR